MFQKLVNYWKKKHILFVVFLTGALVLVLEIVATRVLSPYFGNTIYTVSSVITVILAALSLGYYCGGHLSDRYPREGLFYLIILASGICVFLLEFLVIFFLPVQAYTLPLTTGPLISSFLLFFLPAFILGTLSPFAIKLQKVGNPKEGVGKVSGEVFFYSTLGSIFGSLATGFVFIPYFGVDQIIVGVGTALVIIGAVGLFKSRYKKKFINLLIIFSFILGVPLTFLPSLLLAHTKFLYIGDGLYEKLYIFDGEYNGRPTRFFQQDKSSSGAMYLDGDDLTHDYTKYYVLYKIFTPHVKEALVIGGGVYSVPKKLLNDLPGANIDVSEIEPSLFDLAKKYFKVPEDSRLKNYVADGRRFLYDSPKKYDLIFSDVYFSFFSIPIHFTTKEFFELVDQRLNEGGIFIANIIGDLSRSDQSFVFSEIKTLTSVFPNSYFFAVDSSKNLSAQNLIFVAHKSDKKVDLQDAKRKFPENEILANLSEKQILLDRFELSNYLILTDNYAPVEYLVSKSLSRYQNQTIGFSGSEAYFLVSQQLRYGPRYLTSTGHRKIIDFLKSEMETLADGVILQSWKNDPYELTNIIARFSPHNPNRVILGTHFDTKRSIPGANDGASGVAVLVEIARMLAAYDHNMGIGVDIVFFDGEEGVDPDLIGVEGWEPLGSSYFAKNIKEIYVKEKPFLGIILDMVCDKNLNIYKEKSSQNFVPARPAGGPNYYNKFFEIAQSRYPNNFFDQVLHEISDDHTPLNTVGIPSFIIIDFDYPYFHTTSDSLDKCSSESLQKVGDVLWEYLTTAVAE